MNEINVQRLYESMSYDYYNFSWWYQYIRSNREIKQYKFVHIGEEHFKYMAVKTYNTSDIFMLKVTKFVVKDSEQLAF